MLACGGNTTPAPAEAACSGRALVASPPATLASADGPTAPAGSVFAVPDGYLVFAGSPPFTGAFQTIEAALLKASGDGAAPTVVQTTIAPAGSTLLGAAVAPTGQALVHWAAPGKGGAYVAAVTTSGGTLHVGSPSPTPDFDDNSSVAFDGSNVAFDGTAFLLLGGNSDCCPPPASGLTVQRVGLDGVPVGEVLHAVGSNQSTQLLATLSTPKGAAVLWLAETSAGIPPPGGSLTLHASLITDDGALARDVLLPDNVSGRTPELAWTGDRLLYADTNFDSHVPTSTLHDFGWFGEPASETMVPGLADGIPAMVSGKVYLSVTDSTDANSTHSVYAVTPGGAVEPVAKALPSASILGGDGCGHVLLASAPPRQTGVPYEYGSPWTLSALGSSASASVGSDLPYMYMSTGAFLAGSSSAGFVWSEASMGAASPSTVRFATIGWH